MNRAAFAGTRILLRQVSPESEAIYDFILAVHKLCGGDWEKLRLQAGSNALEIAQFLEYASQFLDALGNYTVSSQFYKKFKSFNLIAVDTGKPKIYSTNIRSAASQDCQTF
jgi:hypothetical protein